MIHYKKYCNLCFEDIVVCGNCGNNTCNGGQGFVNGSPCPDCNSAYDIYLAGDEEIDKLPRYGYYICG